MNFLSVKKKLVNILNNYELYLLLLPTMIYFSIFHYLPMYGVQIAFKDYNIFKGVSGSEWIGFYHFERFMNSHQFWRILNNTITLSLYSMAVRFPIPIILALLLNQLRNDKFKKIVQTITYAPNFISIMVIVGMLFIFLSPSYGLFNQILVFFGIAPIFFMGKAEWFRHVFVWSDLWQSLGISMIIYIAALAGIDPSLHEAAAVDGASKLQRIRHIDIPGIAATISILLILNIGNVMTIGFEKAFLMQNPLNVSTSEVIATYVYKVGLLDSKFSYSAAIGFFNSIINCTLLLSVNYIARRLGQESLW